MILSFGPFLARTCSPLTKHDLHEKHSANPGRNCERQRKPAASAGARLPVNGQQSGQKSCRLTEAHTGEPKISADEFGCRWGKRRTCLHCDCNISALTLFITASSLSHGHHHQSSLADDILILYISHRY